MTYDDSPPDPAESARMEYHFGRAGPVALVYEWLEHTSQEDFDSAWALMDDQLRLCRSQAWLWNNRHEPEIAVLDLDRAARDLAASPSDSHLWTSFAHIELKQLQETWERFLDALGRGTLGAGSHTRAIGPDLELVLLLDIETAAPVVFSQPTLVDDALIFLVRFTGVEWKIAAYGDHLPAPGWPPVLEPPSG